MQKKNELVSVVIPSYNRENTIVRAINSVLKQTYTNIEVIIVDDNSSDNTSLIVAEHFSGEARVIYFRLGKTFGACAARNQGVKLSQGRYVAFLDSDDEYMPEKIENQIALLHESGASLCATDFFRYNKEGELEERTCAKTNEEIYTQLLYGNFITTGTLLGYKECFIETPFDEHLSRFQDWDLALRLSIKYPIVFLREKTLVQYFQPQSISASTTHKKTIGALEIIYQKNIDSYNKNKKCYAQINWLIGIHGLYIENYKSCYKRLLFGATKNGINLKRLILLFLFVSFGGINKHLEKYIWEV